MCTAYYGYMTLVWLHTVFITTNCHCIPKQVTAVIIFLVARFDNGKYTLQYIHVVGYTVAMKLKIVADRGVDNI